MQTGVSRTFLQYLTSGFDDSSISEAVPWPYGLITWETNSDLIVFKNFAPASSLTILLLFVIVCYVSLSFYMV